MNTRKGGACDLEDTLLCYLADGPSWCGEPGSPGEIWGRVGRPWGSAGWWSLCSVSAPQADGRQRSEASAHVF